MRIINIMPFVLFETRTNAPKFDFDTSCIQVVVNIIINTTTISFLIINAYLVMTHKA